MIEFRFNSSYEFCDFSQSDQEDLGTYLIWTLESFFNVYDIEAQVVDTLNTVAVQIVGAKTETERNGLKLIFDEAVAQVRKEVEEGLI